MRSGKGVTITGLFRIIGLPVLVIVVVLWFFTSLSNLDYKTGDEEKKQLDLSIRRVVAACYAAEGTYPPSLEYMEEHYGLQIDEDRYVVDYRIFASNIMPEFTILDKTASHEVDLQGIGQ